MEDPKSFAKFRTVSHENCIGYRLKAFLSSHTYTYTRKQRFSYTYIPFGRPQFILERSSDVVL